MESLTERDYRHLFQTEAAALNSVTAEDLDSVIHHIEGWTVGSVLGHTGWVCRYVDASLSSEPNERPARSAIPEPPPGAAVIEWTAEAIETLQAHLAEVDLNSIRPTWTGPQPASWWLRRITHEVAIHRWDIQSALTSPDPIDVKLASDGIDELLDIFVPARLQFPIFDGVGKTIHLHATDNEQGEWFITFKDDSIEWQRSHAKADVAAKGKTSDLLLMLWTRITTSQLELHGDSTILDRWQQAATF